MSTKETAPVPSDVKDLLLANQGKRRIEWASQSMPVLQAIRKRFIKSQPLAGIRVAICARVTAASANIVIALRDGGASVAVCASNPEVTDDSVAASLVRDYSVPVFAIQGADGSLASMHRSAVLDQAPQVIVEDGGLLAASIHDGRDSLLAGLIGGTEESVAGVSRLKALARRGTLGYPVVAAYLSATMQLFNNRYGTAQSVLDGIMRATNTLIAGTTVVIAGYGSCGRALASRARALGANVVVTEVDPGKALEAILAGCRVMSMPEAARLADLIVTTTGTKSVLGRDHVDRLKDGVTLCNAGHFQCEIDVESLSRAANSRREAGELVEEFKMKDGRRIYLLAAGQPINTAAGDGQPVGVTDISLGTQALAIQYLLENRNSLDKRVYAVPDDLDRCISRIKLDALGVTIDKLTIEQEEFLAAWSEGN